MAQLSLDYFTDNECNCMVYSIKNKVTGKVYIGASIRGRERLSDHRAFLRHGHHNNWYLQDDWNRYGENNFVFDILERLCAVKSEIEKLEFKYIKKYPNSMLYNRLVKRGRLNKPLNYAHISYRSTMVNYCETCGHDANKHDKSIFDKVYCRIQFCECKGQGLHNDWMIGNG
jgi:group I intron endonuclease